MYGRRFCHLKKWQRNVFYSNLYTYTMDKSPSPVITNLLINQIVKFLFYPIPKTLRLCLAPNIRTKIHSTSTKKFFNFQICTSSKSNQGSPFGTKMGSFWNTKCRKCSVVTLNPNICIILRRDSITTKLWQTNI